MSWVADDRPFRVQPEVELTEEELRPRRMIAGLHLFWHHQVRFGRGAYFYLKCAYLQGGADKRPVQWQQRARKM